LNVIPIHLPALAERPEDIPLLVDHFIDKYNRENNKQVSGVTPGTLRMFLKYSWPGNVRELENLIERAVVTSRTDCLTDDDFPTELALGDMSTDASLLTGPVTLAEASKVLILKALERAGGNKTRAAKELDITARTIRNKLAEYGVHGD
jgi:DNA-binding NtrC family response regulator